MAVEIIAKMKPKNNGEFALIDAHDVEFEDGTRLDKKIEGLGQSGSGGSNITVDTELSNTSTNPVQNKVVTEALLKNILNVQISDQDLSKADFVPTPNTYYRHTNKGNALYDYGTIHFYNGNDYEDVEVLNDFVSKWESTVGGHNTVLTRKTNGKYIDIGLGNGSVTNVGFVPTYAQRTDANGVKSTVLVTGNPVNDVDTTPKKYVDDLVANAGGKYYRHNINVMLEDIEAENLIANPRFSIISSKNTAYEVTNLEEIPIYVGLTFVDEDNKAVYTVLSVSKDWFRVFFNGDYVDVRLGGDDATFNDVFTEI